MIVIIVITFAIYTISPLLINTVTNEPLPHRQCDPISRGSRI